MPQQRKYLALHYRQQANAEIAYFMTKPAA
jgi:hypothetical protein